MSIRKKNQLVTISVRDIGGALEDFFFLFAVGNEDWKSKYFLDVSSGQYILKKRL